MSFNTVINFNTKIETPAEFPAVTICNLNPFDMGTNAETGVYINKKLLLNNISPSINVSANDTGISLVKQAANMLKASVIADKLNDTYKRSLGFTIETMLVSCFYNGVPCYASNFRWFWSFDFGNCYTFNADYKTSKAGPTTGLKLELFLGVPGKDKLI